MTPFIAIAVAGLSLATAPAAEPKGTEAAVRVDQPAAQPNPNRRFCFKYEVTGSILPYKTCKTYAEWMKEGVDPTAKSQ